MPANQTGIPPGQPVLPQGQTGVTSGQMNTAPGQMGMAPMQMGGVTTQMGGMSLNQSVSIDIRYSVIVCMYVRMLHVHNCGVSSYWNIQVAVWLC